MGVKNIFNKISKHFLIRNLIIAICALLVFIYLVNLALNIFTRHNQKFNVPDLQGKTIEEVQHLIKDADLKLIVIDSLFIAGLTPGTIIDQSPEPTSYVKSGRKVFLTINSYSPRSEVVPYVTGFSLRQAKNMLETKGFEIKRLIYRSDMATNNVIGESYNGQEIVRGSTIKATLGEGITLTVGRAAGSPLPLVPKVVGLTLREAKSRLWEIGLNVGDIRLDADVNDSNLSEARVYKQTPDQQSRTDYGASVILYLSIDTNRVNQGVKRSDEDMRKAIENPVEDISEEELERLLQ